MIQLSTKDGICRFYIAFSWSQYRIHSVHVENSIINIPQLLTNNSTFLLPINHCFYHHYKGGILLSQE